MVHYCYILYSKHINKFYIGETENIQERIRLHNTGFFKGSYTSQTDDWELYLCIECNHINQARRIERHIKNMKSKRYIENLKNYPEMLQKLRNKCSKKIENI